MTGLAFLGLVMLIVMIGAIFIGFPISFTLLFLALTFGYFGLGDVVFDLAYFQTIGMMKEELLAAVPLFIFMGFITEQAGLMERLFTAFRMLLAPVRGALFVGGDPDRDGVRHGDRHRRRGGDGARHHGGADHDQDRLRREALRRLHHRRRHARHPDPALGDADRDGPGARRLGRRPLRGGVRPRLPARRHLPRCT